MIFKNLSGWWWNYVYPVGYNKFVLKRRIAKKLIPLSKFVMKRKNYVE